MRSQAATASRPEAIVIVFARAPVRGRVKTRLAAAIGAEASARLYSQLIERALATAIAADAGAVELHCAPNARHPFFQDLSARLGVSLRAQSRGNLGTRMHRALAGALRRAPLAILLGSDCPALRSADLRRAKRELASGADAVFSPAHDGGYVLVGVRRSSAALFRGIAWGSAGVMAGTRGRLRKLGWTWRELREVWDVDRAEDYARLRRSGLLLRRP
ncbi:MAG: hypothetical protein A3I63_09065 [Betaproteobacteria bacterium RIFCSPLOWO2_02_FULL_66_14]|nr:MAG: hypothetical protein A3I63_09065 [Betaproteobacteria bacterium RIFCSPLOWO2_02_FULL_66_14]